MIAKAHTIHCSMADISSRQKCKQVSIMIWWLHMHMLVIHRH